MIFVSTPNVSTPNFFASRRQIFAAFFAVFLFFSFGFAQENAETQDPVQLFNQGQDAHEKGDYKMALKFYDAAVKLALEFPEAEFQRGNALLSSNNPVEAEKAFRRALELRADWTLPMTNLGALLIRKNQFAEAEQLLAKAVRTDEQNFSAFSALTELRLKTKADSQILRELLTKIQFLTSKAKPTASIWASRAALERALGDKVSAKASVNRALAIEANNKSALTERAELAISEGDNERAAEDAKFLLQTAPDSIPFKLLQARVYAAQNKIEDAVKILDSIKNSSSEAALLRDTITANSSVNAGELEKQLEKNAKNPTILSRLCALLRTKNPVKALEYCRRASEAEPNDINHAIGFGAALVQAKQFENAAAIFQRILQISPDNFTARANLATAFFESKRFAEAKTEYRRLTEKQPDLPIAYYFLAISHDNLSEYTDAMANYQLFLKLADANQNKLEIEKVNLRLPVLQNQIKRGDGKKGKKKSEK
ncbi:MAG: tetratricopeptide repeat protein [Acidobacteriota bacterium]|nr:tetratricopeptide repeat protein [Acidobacteriota bacterium]